MELPKKSLTMLYDSTTNLLHICLVEFRIDWALQKLTQLVFITANDSL